MSAFETARDFAEHGFRVFPVHGIRNDGSCTCGKASCDSPGKHPRTKTGFKEASSDERTLLQWDDRFPGSNWALACDERVSVVDIDAKAGADPATIISEFELSGPIVTTGVAKGVRGAHVYCAGGVPTAKTATTGVEVRGSGAYVVLPGSRHPSGVPYEWGNGARPWQGQLEPPPEALVKRDPASRQDATASVVSGVIPAQQRNSTLTSMAGTMRRRGFHERAILAALQVTNADRCRPPLGEEEVTRIAHSVARYQPSADITDAVTELTRLLALDTIGRHVETVKAFGRTGKGAVHIYLDGGEDRIVLDPIGNYGSANKLAAEVATQTGATPTTLKYQDVLKALSLIQTLAEHIAAYETEDRAFELGAGFLRDTPVEAATMKDQADRWRVFELQASVGRPGGGPGPFVIEDPASGLRYVRVEWFDRYVRERSGAGETDSILRTMTRLGWTKPGREGRIKATRPGLGGSAQWAFFVVPDGWEQS